MTQTKSLCYILIELEGKNMPRKLAIQEEWTKLLQVMNSVHEKNRGISEKEVYQDVQRAVTELRQEDYKRNYNENKAS